MSDSLRITCPACGNQADLPVAAAGKRVVCNKCHYRFVARQQDDSSGGKTEIEVSCPCGRHFTVPAEHAAKRVHCPACAYELVVPAVDVEVENEEGYGLAPEAPAAKPAPAFPGPVAVTHAIEARSEKAEAEEVDPPSHRTPLLIAGGALIACLALALVFWMNRKESSPPVMDRANITAANGRNQTPFPITTRPASFARYSDTQPADPARVANTWGGISNPVRIPTTQPWVNSNIVAVPRPSTQPVVLAPDSVGGSMPPEKPVADVSPDAANTKDEVCRISGLLGTVLALAFSPDSQSLLVSMQERGAYLSLYDVNSGKKLRNYAEQPREARSVAFSPIENTFLSGGIRAMYLWDANTGRIHETFTGPVGFVVPVAFSRDGRLAISGDSNMTVRVWDLRAKREISRFTEHQSPITGVALMPGEQQAISLDGAGVLYLWDVASATVIRRLSTDTARIGHMAVSPNGRWLLCSAVPSSRQTELPVATKSLLYLRDLTSDTTVYPLVGHTEEVLTVCFSPNGRYALTAGGSIYDSGNPASSVTHDYSARLWQVPSGRQIQKFTRHSQPVWAIAISPDGRYAASAGSDRTVSIWQLPDQVWGKGSTAEPEAERRKLLAEITRPLGLELSALVDAGKLAAASQALDQAETKLESLVESSGLAEWDKTLAPTFQLIERRRTAMEKRAATAPAEDDFKPREHPTPAKLDASALRDLQDLRRRLDTIATSVTNNHLNDVDGRIVQVEKKLNRVLADTRAPVWHEQLAPLFQLIQQQRQALLKKRYAQSVVSKKASEPPEPPRPSASAEPSAGLKVGQQAPPFQAITLDGRPFSSRDFNNKWVLIDFWATWCGPCVAEMPYLKEVYAQFGADKRFVMVSLSLDSEPARPLEFAIQNKLGWVQGFLGNARNTPLLNAYGVDGIPKIILIAPDGTVAATGLRDERIRTAVSKALAKQ